MSMRSDRQAAACRQLWAAVLLAAIDDYNLEHGRDLDKPGGGSRVLEAARRYLNSRDGRTVAALAGVELNTEAVLRIIALPRREFRDRLIAGDPAARGDDDA